MKLFKYNPEIKDEFTLASLWRLLKLHKFFIIIFICLSVVLTGIYSYIIPQTYVSSTTLIPPEDNSGGGGLTSFLQSLSGGVSFGNFGQGNKIQLFQEILKSREVAKIITDTLKLKTYPQFQKVPNDVLIYGAVGGMLDVVLKRTGLIIISSTTKTGYFPNKADGIKAAKFSSDVANASVWALDKLNREKNTTRSHKKRVYIEKVLQQKRKELDSADKNLENFRLNNKVLTLDEQSQAVLNNAVNVSTELAKAEIELNLKLQEFEPNSPAVKLYKEKINNLRNQFQRTQMGGIGNNDKFSIPLSEVPSLIRQYTNFVREQKVLEQVNLYLHTQKYQESIQEESDVPTVEVLDEAIPPLRRFAPDRKLMVLLAFTVSAILAMSIITSFAFYKGMLRIKKAQLKD